MRADWVKKNFKVRVACTCGNVFPCIANKEELHDKKCVVVCEKCKDGGVKPIIGLIELEE